MELKPYPSPILLPLTATGSQSAEAKEKLAALVEGCGEAGVSQQSQLLVLQRVFECLHSQKTLLMTKIMQELGLRASVVNSNIDIPDPVSATAIPPGVAGHGAFGGPPPLHPAQKMMFLDHLIGLQTKQNKSLEEEISGLHEILTAQSKVLSTADRPIVARVLNSVSAASASPMSRASSPATTAMCESPMAMETSVQMAPLPATSSSSSLSFPPSSVAAQNLFAPPSLATNAAVAAAAAAATTVLPVATSGYPYESLPEAWTASVWDTQVKTMGLVRERQEDPSFDLLSSSALAMEVETTLSNPGDAYLTVLQGSQPAENWSM